MSSYDTFPVFPQPLNHSTPKGNQNLNQNLLVSPNGNPEIMPGSADMTWNNNNEEDLKSASQHKPSRDVDMDTDAPNPPPAPRTNFRLSSDSDPKLRVPAPEKETSGPVFFIGTPTQSHFFSPAGMKTPFGTETLHPHGSGDHLSYTIHKNHLQPLLNNEESYECLADGSESFFDSTASDSPSLTLPRDGRRDVSGVLVGGIAGTTSGVSSLPFKRNSQLRTSLRKSPQQSNGETMGHRRCGSFRNASGVKRPIVPVVASSSALATQLYRSSSFHSSGRSSAGDAEEMYSDGSLEDEVIDLTQKVHHLEEKFTVLAENQSDVDERYSRAKQENAELSTKLYMTEEQLRDVEQRGADKLRDEQKRHKEALARLEREKQLHSENHEIRVHALEKDLESWRNEAGRCKQQLERERSDRIHLKDKLNETERELTLLRDDNRKLLDEARVDREALTLESIGSQQALLDLKREFESLRRLQASKPSPLVPQRESLDGDLAEYHSRLLELEKEMRRLKAENKQLQEANDDLTAQVLSHGLEEGRHLLTMNHMAGGENSLAAELEAMTQDQVMTQMKTALKEQKEVNEQLKSYIDGILLNIVENYPQLLEVKTKGLSQPNCSNKN